MNESSKPPRGVRGGSGEEDPRGRARTARRDTSGKVRRNNRRHSRKLKAAERTARFADGHDLGVRRGSLAAVTRLDRRDHRAVLHHQRRERTSAAAHVSALVRSPVSECRVHNWDVPALFRLPDCSQGARHGPPVCSNIGMIEVVAAILEREGRVLIGPGSPRRRIR